MSIVHDNERKKDQRKNFSICVLEMSWAWAREMPFPVAYRIFLMFFHPSTHKLPCKPCKIAM